jgi:hypothetical protein
LWEVEYWSGGVLGVNPSEAISGEVFVERENIFELTVGDCN